MSQIRGQGSQPRVRAAPKLHGDDYFTLSRRPLHILVVLLPLVLVYEVLSLQYLVQRSTGTQQVIKAENLIGQVFDIFGVTGLLVPGLAMLSVLLVWHLISKDRWKIRVGVLLGMFVEALVWALPLLVLSALVQRAHKQLLGSTAGQHLMEAVASGGSVAASTDLHSLSWQARVSISLGAGLYEEMVFRLIGIAALHLLFRDILRWNERLCDILAVTGSAIAFAFYHDVFTGGPTPGALNVAALAFYFLAGLYFAILYLGRGFGIVVLCHAAYDMIVLLGNW